MTKLAETYLRLEFSLSERDRHALQRILSERTHIYAKGLFKQEPEFAVYVEPGSLRTWIVAAGALYAAIQGYGAFRGGLDYIIKDAQTFSERVLADFQDAGVESSDIVRFERRLGTPGRIRRVVRSLDRLDELSEREYSEELARIQRSLLRIAADIDDERDFQLLKTEIPSKILGTLPEPLPQPKTIGRTPLGLRPEEWDWHFGNRLPSGIASIGPFPADSHDSEFRLVRTDGRFRLLPPPSKNDGN